MVALLADIGNLNALIFPEDLDEIMHSAEASFRAMSPFHAEYRIQHPTKSERWLEANSIPEVMEDGSILWHGFITDITERKQMENAQKDSHNFLHKLVDNIVDPIFVKDREHRWMLLNQAFCDFVGYSRDDLIGKSDFDFFPEHEARVFWEMDEEVFISGQENVNEEHLTDFDGNKQTILTKKACYTDTHGHKFIVGIITNITERKQMEEQLSEQGRELRMLIANTPDVITRYDRDCRRSYISPNYEQVYGKPVSAALGTKPTESWGSPSMPPEVFEHLLREVMASGAQRDIELDWFTADGEYVCQSLRVVPEYDANGEVCSALSFARDVSELKRAGRRIQVSEHEFRTLIEHSPAMIIRYDCECRRVFINPAYEKASGFTHAEALCKALSDSWVPENITSEAYEVLLQQVMDSGLPTNVILEWTEPGGLLVSHDMRVVPEYDVNGQLKGTLVIGHNISRLRRAEVELTKREQEFRALVEHSPDTITRYDRECRRIYANPRMQVDAGVPLDALMYKTPEEFPGGEQAIAYQQKIRQVLDSGEVGQFELTWRTHNSKEMCSYIHLTPEFSPEGEVISVLAVGRDITEIDAYRKQIHNLAFFDTLTNLPNRALLSDRVRQTVADASWHGHQFGLMLMDLDRFKEINDTLGHSVGDQVLREAAERLQACVRIYDTVARLGGDEFAALLPEVRTSNDLATIACKILGAFNTPFMVDGRELFITTSIGIALYPDDSADVETLFRYADSAMYHAKQQGRNNFQFYSADLTEKAAGRMTIESDLRKALERHELELYYQPQVELESGRIIGAEALLRWHHGDKGMITPDKFIPVAEDTGLIVGIGEWVLNEACQTAVAWNSHRNTNSKTQRTDPLRIAVNLS
ncbi:MAG TPA: GGDEF domain-containing protein, partial [Oxalobacteraceae bacterium]|nr:GGDEF domain-containing protein [Oxalobacteraceae bacterium]